MTELSSIYQASRWQPNQFRPYLRPIGAERNTLDLQHLSVEVNHSAAAAESQESLSVAILYHGQQGFIARFIGRGQEVELVEMREIQSGRRGKSVQIGVKCPELVRDVVVPILTHANSPWQRLIMGPVIDVVGISDMDPGAQQRMITNLPKFFGLEPDGKGFVRKLK